MMGLGVKSGRRKVALRAPKNGLTRYTDNIILCCAQLIVPCRVITQTDRRVAVDILDLPSLRRWARHESANWCKFTLPILQFVASARSNAATGSTSGRTCVKRIALLRRVMRLTLRRASISHRWAFRFVLYRLLNEG